MKAHTSEDSFNGFCDVVFKCGFPRVVADIMNSGQWEPRPKYISPIMVENMKHIDHGLIQQQKLKCKYNWTDLINPIALHIDHVSKQDDG